jgi:hypothetical protein
MSSQSNELVELTEQLMKITDFWQNVAAIWGWQSSERESRKPKQPPVRILLV